MANIPENTTNPVLRPVTRLETSTKVFGGAYIPDDEQQRGISNLQAIELAERDQYILSRVGQPYVPASGDIPAKTGIAGLDTSGKVPKAQLPSDTVYTEVTQTLTNKTIDAKDNVIRCERILVTQSISPSVADVSKVISYKITGDYAVIKLPVPNDKYTGLQVKIAGDMPNCGYVIFRDWRGGYQCISVVKTQTIYMTVIGGSWIPAQGSVFTTYDTTINNAPLNYEVPQDNPAYGQPYLVNDWKTLKGVSMYSYTYDTSQGALYDNIPSNCTINVTCNYARRGSATIIWTESKLMEFATCIDNVWSSRYRLTDISTAQTLTNKTIDADNNTLKNVVTSKNITNCVTEIPQDIKVSYSGNTITISAGSKVYDGTGATWTTGADISRTLTGTAVYFLVLEKNSASTSHVYPVTLMFSQSTQPTSNGVWFNTSNNETKWSNDGTTWGLCSLPLGLFTVVSDVLTKVQVFNGMGYIDKTLFVLPGVKGLCSDGRNSDGSIKNKEVIVNKVVTYTPLPNSSLHNHVVYYGVVPQGSSVVAYTYPDNQFIYSTDIPNNYTGWCFNKVNNVWDWYANGVKGTQYYPIFVFSIFVNSSGVISNFNPKTVFHAVDYNDLGKKYSTSEVKTNDVWIDGKPIYRKVVTGTTPASGGNKTVGTGVTNGANARLVGGYIENIAGTSHFPLNFYTNAQWNAICCVNTDASGVFLMGTDNGISATAEANFVAIIEYTKTTD